MNKRLVVGFTGLIGAGKTTAAQYLVDEHDFVRVRFAETLKHMLITLGLSWAEIDGSLREKPCELLGGKTPRYAMQTLGTEWGRQLICDDLWVRAWRRAVDCHAPYQHIVVDDVRFENELAAVRAFENSLVIRVSRGVVNEIRGTHASEAQNFDCDVVICNDHAIADFTSAVGDVVEERLGKCSALSLSSSCF
jgi:hypothetical protein